MLRTFMVPEPNKILVCSGQLESETSASFENPMIV